MSIHDLPNERQIFHAQIENFMEKKDYQQHGQCIRFIAVNNHLLERFAPTNTNHEEVEVFFIDIGHWAFDLSELQRLEHMHVANQLVPNDDNELWFELEVEFSYASPRHGYAYSVFTGEKPRYLQLKSIKNGRKPRQLVKRLRVSIPQCSRRVSLAKGSGKWSLHNFHVGQGMCSLLTDEKKYGVLLDAGAGTPIFRGKYPDLRINELRDLLTSLPSVTLVLSHIDSDHYRLLDWDPALFGRIRTIFIPRSPHKNLVLESDKFSGKLMEVSRTNFDLHGGGSLELRRSKPKYSSNPSNTNCLVAVYRSQCGKRALLSGDYVYKDIAQDQYRSVKRLATHSYDAIVVPHHGDKPSSKNIFSPAKTGTSIALFSAGDNKKCGHPTPISVSAHAKAGYVNIHMKLDFIKKRQLVP